MIAHLFASGQSNRRRHGHRLPSRTEPV